VAIAKFLYRSGALRRQATVFTRTQLERYAEVLMWGLKTARRNRYKNDDAVMIRFDADALPLAEQVYKVLVASKLNPILRLNPTRNMQVSFFKLAGAKQLDFIGPGDLQTARNIQGSISLLAPASLTHLGDVDPRKISRSTKAYHKTRQIYAKREAAGEFSWTLCMYPTAALAEHAGISLKQYTHQIVRACFLDKKSPLSEWKKIHRRAQDIKKRLARFNINRLRIESAGTDLTVCPGKMRQWVGVTGRNIPSFELFLSPDWRLTDGIFFADQPSFRNGNLVRGVAFEFAKGQLKAIRAEQGEKFIQQQLAVDAGASRIGEFSLTDKRFSRINRFMANTLYDENFGGRQGNCHIAVGASYSNTYAGDPAGLTAARKRQLGFNESALHWDFVNTRKKRVTASLEGGGRKVIYENGVFTI
jgi:aminopeptidase